MSKRDESYIRALEAVALAAKALADRDNIEEYASAGLADASTKITLALEPLDEYHRERWAEAQRREAQRGTL